MKKIFALVLSVVLVMSYLTVPVFSAESNYDLAEETELLYALGITLSPSVSDSQLGAQVTRGEAAKYFCRVLNMDVADPTGFESVFYDVTSEIPNYKYISAVCKAGHMEGYGDGRFRPSAPISTKEAALVLARILGYKSYTAVAGLDAVISKTDLLEGVSVVDELEVGQFLKMIYNALHAPACVATGISSDAMDYKIDENYLGIEYLFDVSPAEGIVDGIQGSGLTQGGYALKEGRIMIDGFEYLYPEGAEDLFGFAVDFYYRNDADTYDIVYIKKSDRNRVTVLNYDEIIGYSDFTYSYEKNNSTKTLSIEADTDIIFNGVAYIKPTDEDMVPKYGQVTLIDNDNDRKFEVASIESNEFIVVDSVNAEKKIIRDKDKVTVINMENADKISVTCGDAEYSLDRLYSGNLLKIRRSKEDSGYYKVAIDVNKDEENGAAITAAGTDSFTALGKTFEVWDNIDEKSKENIAVGKVVAIYTYDGLVVRVVKENSGSSYAYLLSISEPKPLSEELRFRLVLPDTTETIFEKGKNIKIDGRSITAAADVEAALLPGAAKSSKPSVNFPLSQPVKYTLNKDGKLASIDTLYFNAEAEDAETSLRKLETGTYRYRTTSGSLYNKDTSEFAAICSNYLCVPTTYRNDIPDYKSEVPSDNGTFIMDICNVDEDTKIAEFAFYFREAYSTGTSSAFYVVMNKNTELNDEGEIVNYIDIASGGKTTTYKVVDELIDEYNSLEIGDVIRITLNGDRDIRGLTKIYSISSSPALEDRVFITQTKYNTEKIPPYTDGNRILYGTALNLEGENLLFTPSLTTDLGGLDETYLVDNLKIGSATVYKYSDIRGAVTIDVVTADEIVPYSLEPDNPSTVVVDISSNTVKQIFVIDK